MTVPDWRASTAGTRVRVALWLHSEVGEHGTFTKAQLRDAFPGVEQVDRRMRDLRAEGWIIATYRQDRSLSADELRLVREGGRIWERGYRSRAASSVTDKERQATFAADGYACRHCGIMGGDTYPDDPVRTATLTLARVPAVPGAALLTLCDRCHAGAQDQPADGSVLDDLGLLDDAQRARLAAWVTRGARPDQPEEALWRRYRRLPAGARREFEERLKRGD